MTDLARSGVCVDGTVVLYDDAGDEVLITAEQKGVRFLLVSGRPLQEFEAGTFVKERP